MLSRRRFLALAAAASGALSAPALTVLPAGAAPVFQRTRAAMNTFVTLNVSDTPRALAEEAVEAAFAEIARLENVFSRFDGSAALAELNSRGRLDAPPELAELLARCKLFSRRTAGGYDPTVGPLLALFCSGRTPSRAELAEALELTGLDRVRVGPRGEVAFSRPGMSLTLDGAAKGYIVDAAAAALSRAGARGYLVNAGGDVRAQSAPGEPGWRIGVQDPFARGELIATVSLSSGALATSGSYESPRPHLVDPATGRASGALVSATVRAATCAEADALSTAFMVGDARRSLALARAAGARCLLVGANGGRAGVLG